MRINFKTVSTPSGELFYRVAGEPSGSVLLFVHGVAGDSRLFHNQLRYLGHKFRTLAVDLPGHGRSFSNHFPSLEEYSDVLFSMLDQEKADRIILIGHSMGGGVCIEMYEKYKTPVAGIVLVSSSPVLNVTADLLNLIDHNFEEFYERMIRLTFSRKAGLFAGMAVKKISPMFRSIIKNDLEISSLMDYSKKLELIDVPVMLIANTGDTIVPVEKTLKMQEKIVNSSCVVFDAEGHVPFFENAAAFNHALEGFILQCFK